MTTQLGIALTVLMLAAPPSAQAQTGAPPNEDVEPRIIGTTGTTSLGFSGYVDKFFSPESRLPTNYTLEIDVGRFLTRHWVARAGISGSGSYGGDEADELLTGSGAPALHALGGLHFYFTPRSIWSAYAGVEYGAQLTRRVGTAMGSLVGSLGLQGAVSSRASVFIEGGFGRSLGRDEGDNRLSRFVGKIGIRLKLSS